MFQTTVTILPKNMNKWIFTMKRQYVFCVVEIKLHTLLIRNFTLSTLPADFLCLRANDYVIYYIYHCKLLKPSLQLLIQKLGNGIAFPLLIFKLSPQALTALRFSSSPHSHLPNCNNFPALYLTCILTLPVGRKGPARDV